MTRLLIAMSLALMMAGCSAHYRQALEDYRKAEPLPFARKTQAWVNAADRAVTASQLAVKLPTLAVDIQTTSPREVFLDLAARFFEMEPGELRPRLNKLENPEQMRRALTGTVSLEDLLLAVALYTPSVKAARERWQAALNQYSQADYLEQLVAQYRTFARYLKVETGMPLNKQMDQAFFPYPSTIALKGELIRQQIRLAELDWQIALRDAVVDAGKAFFEYQYLVRAEVTTTENVTLVKNLLDVVNERYRAGSASQADLLKMQTEFERQRNMLQDIQANRQSAVARINALLDRPAQAALGRPEDNDLAVTSPTLPALTDAALEHRQEMNMQKAKVQRAAVAIRLGEVMNRPPASRGYSLLERGMMPEASGSESRPSYGLEAKTKDRPSYAQAESYLAEMRRRLDAEEATLAQIKAQTSSMAKTYLQDLDIARREVALIRQIVLPQDRSAYETDLSAYSAGRVSFIDLLDAERALLGARLELDRDRRDLNQTLVRLPMIRGTMPVSFTRSE